MNSQLIDPASAGGATIPYMTVCIGALADNGKSIILTADKMLTATNASVPYQYEQDDVNKIYHFTDTKIVLLAGTIQHAVAILENTHKKIGVNTTKKFKEVVDELKKQYDDYRAHWLEEGIIKPRGIESLKVYYDNHAKYNLNLSQTIDNALASSKFDVQFIVAGYEEELWHILLIQNDLHPQLKSSEGYATIGSGGAHATYTLLDSEYSKTKTREAVKTIVEMAKTKAERSPGVGKGLNTEEYDGAIKK
jgi:20S proteasome alpha/beta subunit